MAHFAKMNGDVVETVIVVSNAEINDLPFPQSEPIGIEFCKSLFGQDTEWLQTSYGNSFRKWFAGPGFTYDGHRDAFIPPKEYPSWILNEETCRWEPPVPHPGDGKQYFWDEAAVSWAEMI